MPIPPDELLSRKEIASVFERDRITVYRWERQGLRLLDGRATAGDVAWFLELRDAARTLGLDPRRVTTAPRPVQEQYLRAARATSCNIGEGDSAHGPS